MLISREKSDAFGRYYRYFLHASASMASLVFQVVKNLPAIQETWVWSLGPEVSPGEGSGYPRQYSFLGNFMDRGAL